MGNQRDRQFTLPKNIRQMGQFGDTYKIYVEDFVYTYVHRTLHMEKQEHEIAAAVLLGKTYRRNNQEYIFISGAQQVSFSEWGQADGTEPIQHFAENNLSALESDAETDTRSDMQKEDVTYQKEDALYDVPVSAIASQERQQQFWEKVYQGIKEYFSDLELLGWYFNLDGDNLEISASMQQFFDGTEDHGSRFLYFEDRLDRRDAFFVQEQHSLQRVEGYAVYYEKNPAMQEFLVAQHRHIEPLRTGQDSPVEAREDVAQNYRAILKKLNEKPTKKRRQPVVYVAGIAVLAVVAATGITQVGNYKNLKTLEQTLQTFSGNVKSKSQAENKADLSEDAVSAEPEQTAQSDGQKDEIKTGQESQQDSTTQGAEQGGSDAQESADQGQTETVSENPAEAPADATETATDTSEAASIQEPRHYTVKKGDSLMSISKEIYHNTTMIDEICSVNQIENMDMIYEGQDLILP